MTRRRSRSRSWAGPRWGARAPLLSSQGIGGRRFLGASPAPPFVLNLQRSEKDTNDEAADALTSCRKVGPFACHGLRADSRWRLASVPNHGVQPSRGPARGGARTRGVAVRRAGVFP